MGAKNVALFLGFSIAMVFLFSPEVTAARILGQTFKTVDASQVKPITYPIISPNGPPSPACNRNVYGSCIGTGRYKKRPCNYKTSCGRGPPAQAQP